MAQAITLLIGAVGALAAIFLKEAIQQALQRRVIAWQLVGYLMAWKANLLQEPLGAIFLKVQEREKALGDSLERGSDALQAEFLKQTKEREELQKSLRELIKEAVSKQESIVLDEAALKLLTIGADALKARATLLADSKTFLSDKDAAMLGKVVAVSAIQFRTALLDCIAALEGLLRVLTIEGVDKGKILAGLTDQIVIHGERTLMASIRLERRANSVANQSVPTLIWNIWCGR